jgi:transposase
MKRGLSPKQKKVIQELVMRDVTGKTIAEIAEEYGVSERTIYRWKNDEEFVAELNRQADIYFSSFLNEAYHRLKTLIRRGRSEQAIVNAIKLVLQSQGKLKEVQEVDAKVTHDVVKDGVTDDMFEELDELLRG